MAQSIPIRLLMVVLAVRIHTYVERWCVPPVVRAGWDSVENAVGRREITHYRTFKIRAGSSLCVLCGCDYVPT